MRKPSDSILGRGPRLRRLGAPTFLGLAIVWSAPVLAGSPVPSLQLLSDTSSLYAFEHVTVIPMEGERTLRDHTVIVQDDRIVSVGPSGQTELPEGAVRIEGRGRYLVPGLADMYVRLPSQSDPMRAIVDEALFLFVANGVTTVRSMAGAPYQLDLRNSIAAGETLGPALYVASPSVSPDTVSQNSGAAQALVRGVEAADYDLMTLEPGNSQAAWELIANAAQRVGFPWSGDLPDNVDLDRVGELGVSTLDHLEGYRQTASLQRDAGRLARAGIFVVPAQYLSNHRAGWNHLFGWLDRDSILDLPEFRFVSSAQKDEWGTLAWEIQARAEVTVESARAHAEARRQMLNSFHEADVIILAGTDAPQLFNVQGFSLHRELHLLVEAGLTPFEALGAATRGPAQYVEGVLEKNSEFGAIAPGLRADLILLEDDPLERIEALQSRVGVMVRGRWIPEEEIQERLEAIAERYQEFDTD